MKVFVVEDELNSVGRIYAIFVSKSDAEHFAETINKNTVTEASVSERTVFYGQPPVIGFNP